MPKTSELHPVLVRRIALVHDAMRAAGMPMRITDGVRTAEMQAALYQIGRSKPGTIVTNADGVKVKSKHQPHEDDGYGHAVDSAFVVGNSVTWDVPDSWWEAYGALCRAVGLRWGIKIGTWIDRPHAELPQVG
jgi:peptidoglycan L-alanyl-D-glutamate endopeptidase CwlK